MTCYDVSDCDDMNGGCNDDEDDDDDNDNEYDVGYDSQPPQLFSAFSDSLLFMILLNLMIRLTDGPTYGSINGQTDSRLEMRARIQK